MILCKTALTRSEVSRKLSAAILAVEAWPADEKSFDSSMTGQT